MEECNNCSSKMKNKRKHQLLKKRKCFSNLTLNEYIEKNVEIGKFKDIIQSYYDKHKKKFDNFTVCVMWMKNVLAVNKNSVPSTITYSQNWNGLPIVKEDTACDSLDTFDRNINDEVDEIVIIFISDLKDETFSHYIVQPKSMLCRKLLGSFIEEDFGDINYNWLPNCFRHI